MEQRLLRLERWNRVLAGSLAAMAVGMVVVAAAPTNDFDLIHARQIILSDPNGSSRMILKATQDQCTFEMLGAPGEKSDHNVSIYRTGKSSVIGTYGTNLNNAALATTADGSVFQLAGAQKKVVLSPQNWSPQTQGPTAYEVRFTD